MGIVDDPEWRRLLAERRGHPSGDHIKSDADGEEVLTSSTREDREFAEQVASALHRLQSQGEPPPAKKLFDGTITWPMILSLGVVLTGVVSFGVGSWIALNTTIDKVRSDLSSTIGTYQNQTNENINQIATSVKRLGDSQEIDRKMIESNQKNAEDRRAVYVPQLESTQRAQDVTNTRIDNITKSIADLRDVVQDLAKVAQQTHTDMEVLKVQTQQEQSKGPPHDR